MERMIEMEETQQRRHPGLWIRILILVCLSALVAGGGYAAYYLYRQSQVQITPASEYRITGTGDDWEGAAGEWLNGLLAQYQQDYIASKNRLDAWEIGVVQLIEEVSENEAAVQVDFTCTARRSNSQAFDYLLGAWNGNQLHCQLVLIMVRQEDAQEPSVWTYQVPDMMRPAAYDLSQYSQSELKEKEEYDREHVQEIPYEKKQYTYRILDGVCSVSYDGGATWTRVPAALEDLTAVGDGNPYYNQLQEGSYLITPEKTVFVYGAAMQVKVLYSEDQGKSWKTTVLDTDIPGIRAKFCSFPTPQVGYLVLAGSRTMSQEGHTIYKTEDGGATWKVVGNDPSTRILLDARFISEDVGFFSYPQINYESSGQVQEHRLGFYRTQDGGENFELVSLPIDEEHQDIFIEAEAPYFEGSKLVVLVNQGDSGDYMGGRVCAKFVSEDLGATWSYLELVEPMEQEIG